MNQQLVNMQKYGYVISLIHGKEQAMLKEDDYTALKNCDSLEELVTKLTRHYSQITEDMSFTKTEIKKRLNASLKQDVESYLSFKDSDLKIIIDYYIDYHRIQNFFFLLQCKTHDPELEKSFDNLDIGNFPALQTLKFCKDMNDVQKYCVENSFLKKYYYKKKFSKEFINNDFQEAKALFTKIHIEETYSTLENTKYMREILELEGDRQIVEITLNTLLSKDLVGKRRANLFPSVCTLDYKTFKLLAKVDSYDDFRGILSNKYKNAEGFPDVLIRAEINKYLDSFYVFNDLSCVYSYLKLKEQEIKNILWIAECISQNRRDAMSHIFVHESRS